MRQRRASWRQRGEGCRTSLTEIDDYHRIFTLPRAVRLEAIGASVARDYCGSSAPGPFVDTLRRQNGRFREYVTADPDGNYYLFPAVAEAAGFMRPARGPTRPQIQETAGEYGKFFGEMNEAARAQGMRFTVVLIPEAAMVDESFQRFWGGLTTFQEIFAPLPELHLELAKSLDRRDIETIDLASEPGLMQGAYWELDGHFNELGNQRVAERIAAELAD
jgi:hypothetical protein